MRPVGMTVDRMRMMNEEHGEEIRLFRERVTLADLEHEDNATALLLMSHNLGINFDELCMHIWLQMCIAENAFSSEELSQICGLDLSELEDYIQEQIETMRRDKLAVDSPFRMTPVDLPWEKPEDQELDLQEGAENLVISE